MEARVRQLMTKTYFTHAHVKLAALVETVQVVQLDVAQ